jgi:alpha-mannosidase
MAHAASQWDQIADRVQRASDDFLHPLRGITLRSAPAVPEPLLGVELHGDGLALSAIKESEDGRYLVLRCVNTTSKAVRGSWRLGHKVKSAKLARLDETPIKAVKLASGSRIPFRAPPFGVVTILAR